MDKTKNTMDFHITLDGPDTDFGLSKQTYVKVTFNDGLIWDEDMIREAKKMLADFYDVYPKRVLTSDDVKKEEKDLDEYLLREIKNSTHDRP